MKRPTLKSLKCALLVCLFACEAFPQQMFPVQACRGQRYEVKEEPTDCKEWFIEWRRPNGRVWGRTSAKTREALIRQRDADIRFQHRLARFFRTEFDPDWKNPTEPTCDACTNAAFLDSLRANRWPAAEQQMLQNSQALATNWASRTAKAAAQFVLATEHGNPFANVGGPTRDFLAALSNVSRQVSAFQHEIGWVSGLTADVMSNIESITRNFETSAAQFTRSYNSLPPDLRGMFAEDAAPYAGDAGGYTPGRSGGGGEPQMRLDARDVAQSFRLAAESMKGAADMAAENGDRGEQTCYMSWSRFFGCWAGRYESGSRSQCQKPSCDLGVAGLPDLMSFAEEETMRASRGEGGSGRAAPPISPRYPSASPSTGASGGDGSRDGIGTGPASSGAGGGRPAASSPGRSGGYGASSSPGAGSPSSGGGGAYRSGGAPADTPRGSTGARRAERDWTDEASERLGFVDGKSGYWVTEYFKVKCSGSDALFKNTYLTAKVVDSAGRFACLADHIHVKNHSQVFPAYFGITEVLNYQLNPGETKLVRYPVYRDRDDKTWTEVEIKVKYWKSR